MNDRDFLMITRIVTERHSLRRRVEQGGSSASAYGPHEH
jgi:hypothetical protein